MDERAAAVALPVLRAALQPHGPWTWQAATALKDLGPAARDAVPDLIRVLAAAPPRGDDGADAGEYAWVVGVMEALGAIGRDAETALVDAALRSPDPGLRQAATRVIRKYYPESAKKLP